MDQRHAKNLLIEEQEKLQSLQNQIRDSGELDQSQQEFAGSLSSHDQHAGDSATQTFQRERDESIEEMIETQRSEIADALQRIDNDEYGRCQQCGREISDERLEALPATRSCREHAQQQGATEGVEIGWEITQELDVTES
ncbi:MAG TPA: TraR/DksA C4-type zinc finger protein [Acidimicrobiia bacterium]|nr:TraR/DksA C4-type zinc finger protein [Acidimicrobiia bacterium]